MAHHHQTTEDVDPDCPRCQEELEQYWADVEAGQRRAQNDEPVRAYAPGDQTEIGTRGWTA